MKKSLALALGRSHGRKYASRLLRQKRAGNQGWRRARIQNRSRHRRATPGTYYGYGMAMGSILQEKTGIKFDVQSTGASKANIQLIQTGEATWLSFRTTLCTTPTPAPTCLMAHKPRISRLLQRFIRSFARSRFQRKRHPIDF